MSAASPPRFERRQVVKNLSIAFGTLVRSYRLGLQEMIFEGNEPNGVIRDAILDALSKEGIVLRPPDVGLKCDMCHRAKDEIEQRVDFPGVTDSVTGKYRAAWICSDCVSSV